MNQIQQKTSNSVSARYNPADHINEADRTVLRYEVSRNLTLSSGTAGIAQHELSGVISNYAVPLQCSQIVYYVNDVEVAESEYIPVPTLYPVVSKYGAQKMLSFSAGTGSSQMQNEIVGSLQWNPALAEVQILSVVTETTRASENLPVSSESVPEADSGAEKDIIQAQEIVFKAENGTETVTASPGETEVVSDIVKNPEDKNAPLEMNVPDRKELSVTAPLDEGNDIFNDVSSLSQQSDVFAPESAETEPQYNIDIYNV